MPELGVPIGIHGPVVEHDRELDQEVGQLPRQDGGLTARARPCVHRGLAQLRRVGPAAVLEQQTVLIESVDDALDVGLNGGGSGGVAREAARDRVGDGPGVVPAVAVGEHERVGELDRAGGPPVGAEGEGATGGEEPEIRAGAGVASPGR
jgi:hypothetical protein